MSDASPDEAAPSIDELHSLTAGSEPDRRWRDLVHPPAYENPTPPPRYNLVVLGGGTAGLVSAIGASVLGARVALVERALLGGDCLNFGCVPSKALIRAATAAYEARSIAELGVRVAGVDVDFARVMERVRAARAEVAPHDAAKQVASFGVDVFFGDGRFVSRDVIEVEGKRLRFRKAILATGGRPAVPSIPGLAQAGFLTNETVFSLTTLPRRLAVLGGGPVGCELAQAFARLGAEVTLVQRGPRLLPREDEDASQLLVDQFRRERMDVRLQTQIARVERSGMSSVLVLDAGGGRIEIDAILVATGREPSLRGLGIEAAEIAVNEQGVIVDPHLRTTNRRVLAAGDVASQYKFTHAADALARLALQNALFFGRKKAGSLVIPWCTYTDPEIAHVGITTREAARMGGVATHTLALDLVDRAIVESDRRGFARVHVDARGRILGATLVSRHAGELISEVVLAMTSGLRLTDVGRAVVPYPTRSEVWKRLADEHARTRLTPPLRGILARWFDLVR